MPTADETERHCLVCGKVLHYSGRGRPPLWCSATHRAVAYQRRRAYREMGLPDPYGLDDDSKKSDDQ